MQSASLHFSMKCFITRPLPNTLSLPYIQCRSFGTRIVLAASMSKQKFDINSKCTLPSGHEMPILGYGVYQTPAQVAAQVVTHAINCGYRHVDSAVVYRNEGPSAAGMLADTSIPRADLFFTSKVPPGKMTYKDASACVDTSLKTTGLDYIDLYLLHAPYGGKQGRLGAWKALVEKVEQGKVRSIGVSNYGVHHLDELEKYIKDTDAKHGKGKGGILSVNQVELHPWLARPDITKWCKDRGVVLQAYSPLARAQRINDPLLKPLCKKYGKTPAQVLLRWSLQKGFIPLPKSVTFGRIEENAQIYDFEISEDDMEVLETGEYSPSSWDPTKSTD